MSSKPKIVAVIGFILVCAVLVSCPFFQSETGVGGTGALQIELATVRKRTLLPDLVTDPAYFEISGVGPAERTFFASTSVSTTTFEELAIGFWDITAAAHNESGASIGRGSGTTKVRTGEIVSIQLHITPVPGQGAASVSVVWNGFLVAVPEVLGQLRSGLGAVIDLPFSIVARGEARADLTGLEAGYYTMSVSLMDGETVVAGLAEVVRILAGETTEGFYRCENINKPGQAIYIQAESLIIAWEPPESSIVMGYRVYYRNRGTFDWTALGEAPAQSPFYVVTAAALPFGAYEFAISSLSVNDESGLHCSMDDSAEPSFGWYVVWSAP